MQIKKLTPNLVVRNVEDSLKFYGEILGLEKAMTVPQQSPYVFASVSNGSVEVFFNDRKTVAAEYPKLAATIGASLTLYMEVDNLQEVLDRVQKAEATISMPVTDQFYGMREFAFEDGDGYTITCAEDGVSGRLCAQCGTRFVSPQAKKAPLFRNPSGA